MSENCPIECREGAISILTTLRKAGFETYFAGGCVRDRLLSSTPTEYDIATAARPDDIKKLFPKARSIGEAFGVMLIRSHQNMYDVATFRSDTQMKSNSAMRSMTLFEETSQSMECLKIQSKTK